MKSTPNMVAVTACLKTQPMKLLQFSFYKKIEQKNVIGYKGNFYII